VGHDGSDVIFCVGKISRRTVAMDPMFIAHVDNSNLLAPRSPVPLIDIDIDIDHRFVPTGLCYDNVNDSSMSIVKCVRLSNRFRKTVRSREEDMYHI
jgi:hypothetical protein